MNEKVSTNEEMQMNKMGVAPIKKLMLLMGLPMIVSMALQAVYNIVDSYFVSCMKDTDTIQNMGDYAVNALTLAFPVQMLMVAVGVGTGVGINAILSKSLGEGNKEKASRIAGNAIFLGVVTYLVFLIFGIFGVDAYLRTQTSDPVILDIGHSYLTICSVLSFGIILYMIYEKILQGTGRTMMATVAQLLGAGTNIVLDPILIFGIGPFPKMGIDGAAYATVIGQCVSWIADMIFHYGFNKELSSKLSYLKPDGQIIKDIYKIGVPAIIMQALMSFMTYGVNIIFKSVSTTCVTAYGIYYKIQQFVFFAAFGMNNAMIPIISFNYGKRDKKRVKEGIFYGMLYTVAIMAIGAVLLQIFAHQVAGIFALSSETQDLCIIAIRIVTLGYLFVGANIAYQGIFQALGCGVRSLIVSLIRLIVVALPLAWVFTLFSNAKNLVWISFPVAEGLALILAILLMKKINQTIIKELN